MKKLVSGIVALAAFISLSASPVLATTSANSQQQMNQATTQKLNEDQGNIPVVNLEPFSAQANYMSLAGYYRYRYFASTGLWLTHGQAVAAVENQQYEAAQR